MLNAVASITPTLFGRASLCLCLLFVSPPVYAQVAPSVTLPHSDVAAGDHAESIVVNPAGISLTQGLQLSYTFHSASPNSDGDGHALMASLTLGSVYGTGFAYEKINPVGRQDSLPSRLSWGHSLALSRFFALGLTWHYHSGRDLGNFDQKSTFTTGLQLRPARWMSMGLIAERLQPAGQKGLNMKPVWGGGLSVRPGIDYLQLSGVGRYDQEFETTTLGGRLRINLFEHVSLVARYDTRTLGDERQHQFMVGLSSLIGMEAGVFYSNPWERSSGQPAGFATTIRTLHPSHPPRSTLHTTLIAHVRINTGQEYGTYGFIFKTAGAPFLSLLRRLRQLETAENVSGVLLQFDTSGIGWAQSQELAQAIQNLKKAGKTVYAWIPLGDSRSYSVAALADEVVLTPSGGVLLTGLAAQSQHIKDFLSMLGINADFVTTGKYKTYPETFTRSTPSEATNTVQNNLSTNLYDSMVQRIALGRKKTVKEIQAIVDDGPYTAGRAKDKGLVDHVMHFDEFETYLRRRHGTHVRIVPSSEFAADPGRLWGPRHKIGVLYIVGTITDGPSSAVPFLGVTTTGADTIVQGAEAFARNNDIKAVVVRIDSPGGSVTASDAMWHALSKLAKAKPLYVSMGDMAASGGYYAAVPGRGIFAMDDTITGSIGVFTGKFDLSGLYKKLGVNIVEYRRGQNSGLLALHQPWSPSQRKAVQRSITAMYDLFLKRILQSRPSLKEKALRAVAAGRVWLGDEAKTHQLVDYRGGLLDAIDAAAKAARLESDDYDLAIGPGPASRFALPKGPFGTLGHESEKLDSLVRALPTLLKPVLNAWSQPILRFPSGQILALFPWTIDDLDSMPKTPSKP